MSFGNPPFKLFDFIIFIFIIFIINIVLTDHEAFPHMTTNNDEYDDYYIPKGTILQGKCELVLGLIYVIIVFD